MDYHSFNPNVGVTLTSDLSEWVIDYKLAQDLSRTRTRTVASNAEIASLCEDVALCVGFDATVVATILALEYDFPNRSMYRASATRDDGSKTYRGITQASMPFWADVRDFAQKKGLKFRSTRPEDGTLFEQIIAPFIYLDRYRGSVASHLVTPAMIYALHQQGPGAARQQFSSIVGSQSGRSVSVVKIAQQGARGRALDFYL